MKKSLHLKTVQSFYKGIAFSIVLFMSLMQGQAQNQVYWREGFETTLSPANTFPSSAPPAGNPAASAGYYLSNAGVWYVFGAYRTTGTSCVGSNYGAPHVRFSSAANTGADSAYIVTPIVNYGIKEFHIARSRNPPRPISIWVTDDTLATTTNWSLVAFLPSSTLTTLCADTTIMVNSSTGRRIRINSKIALDNDIDSIWLTSVNQIIPVEMVSFSGKKQGRTNQLTWTTASEVGNKGFNIERGQGTENGWENIGFVKGNGKGSTYNFVDENPSSNASSYYRLRQVDFDGKETLSKVISIANDGTTKLVKVYPSVTSGLLTVDTDLQGDYQIVNLLGQVVKAGTITNNLDVSFLSQGTYVIKVGTEQVKFIKK